MAQGTTPPSATVRKQKVGRVVSSKMDKTVVVAVDYLRPHPIYRKTVRKTNKFYAHDENNRATVGDTVRIEETRPLSKTKRWRVVEILNAGLAGEQATVDQEVAAALSDDEGVQS